MDNVHQITEEQRYKIDVLCFKINGLGLILDCLQPEHLPSLDGKRANGIAVVGEILQDLSRDILDITSDLEVGKAGEVTREA